MSEFDDSGPSLGSAPPPPAYPPRPLVPPATAHGAGGGNSGSRGPLVAAAITGVATVAAAVIAAVATGGDNRAAARPDPAVVTSARSAATAPPAVAAPPSPAAEQSVQSLPVQTPAKTTKKAGIQAAPDTGPRGSVVTITGSGFTPGERVRVSFRGSYGETTDIRDVSVAADGGFAAEVRLPPEYLNDQEKSFEVRGLDSGRHADTPFTITG